MYRSLDSDKTIQTLARLNRRIEERFPASGLNEVCAELCAIANENRDRVARYVATELPAGAVVVVGVLVLVYSVSMMEISLGSINAVELVQISEAALNDIVLIGAAISFLITVETRVKRARALDALHELRSIVHVIDMHQLTKDPGRVVDEVILTPSSPATQMSAYEMTRYLDYCSEMLSLTGKVAALYAQNLKDAVVLSAVNELESLTTGLSRKIWQKIMIVNKLEEGAAANRPVPPAGSGATS